MGKKSKYRNVVKLIVKKWELLKAEAWGSSESRNSVARLMEKIRRVEILFHEMNSIWNVNRSQVKYIITNQFWEGVDKKEARIKNEKK